MNSIEAMKVIEDDINIEFEVIQSETDNNDTTNRIVEIDEKLNTLNQGIDVLTNHADGWDYALAVSSGVIAGLIDSFFVGEFSLDTARNLGSENVNELVIKIAQKKGYKGNDLQGAIKTLEGEFHLAGDGGKAFNKFGGSYYHHIRDFRHHPTPVGLFFSMLTQFTGKAYGTTEKGVFTIVDISGDDWIGKDMPQKFLFGTVNWFFHMISDMAGSNATAGAGIGLPGPLVAFISEISTLPFFKKLNDKGNKELSVWISKLFIGTLHTGKDINGRKIRKPFDLRTEIGVGLEIGKQAIPVVINECVVRAFYFIRHFVMELKEKDIHSVSELGKIEWQNTLPIKNRTIIRMLTISSSTFLAVDLADSAIRAALNSAGEPVTFGTMFLLRVNIIGVGRCVIAIGTDVYMGAKRDKLRNEQMILMTEKLFQQNVQLFYKQADVWRSAKDAISAVEETSKALNESLIFTSESFNAIDRDIAEISKNIDGLKRANPKVSKKMSDILKWD